MWTPKVRINLLPPLRLTKKSPSKLSALARFWAGFSDMAVWKSIFGWRTLSRWDVQGAIVPGIFVAVAVGMLGVDWFPHNLFISQVCSVTAGILVLLKALVHAIETPGSIASRVLFVLTMFAFTIVGSVWVVMAIQNHKDKKEIKSEAKEMPSAAIPENKSSDPESDRISLIGDAHSLAGELQELSGNYQKLPDNTLLERWRNKYFQQAVTLRDRFERFGRQDNALSKWVLDKNSVGNPKDIEEVSLALYRLVDQLRLSGPPIAFHIRNSEGVHINGGKTGGGGVALDGSKDVHFNDLDTSKEPNLTHHVGEGFIQIYPTVKDSTTLLQENEKIVFVANYINKGQEPVNSLLPFASLLTIGVSGADVSEMSGKAVWDKFHQQSREYENQHPSRKGVSVAPNDNWQVTLPSAQVLNGTLIDAIRTGKIKLALVARAQWKTVGAVKGEIESCFILIPPEHQNPIQLTWGSCDSL